VLGGLLAGRWATAQVTETLWSSSLGALATHNAIFQLKLALVLLAFATAAAWSLGNVYVVFRAIGSVHLPRRLGNVEIVEVVPRRHLALIALALGLGIAVALSYQASSWWYPFALLGSRSSLELPDPILYRDLTYYLFRLPWQRTLLAYLTTLSAVLLAVVGALYGLIGAIRIRPPRVIVADWARIHLGVLLATCALALAAGFLLEPAVRVASLGHAPQDAVLAARTAPAARLLAATALLAGLGSLAWAGLDRLAFVLIPWGALAALAAAHLLLPRSVAEVRRIAPPELQAAGARFAALAYGGPALDTIVSGQPLDARALAQRYQARLATVPVWDEATLTDLLNRTAVARPFERFSPAALSLYRPASGGPPVPVFLSAREVDLLAARETAGQLSWERVHRGDLSRAGGVFAVLASRAGADGAPLFVADLSRPDSAREGPVPLAGLAGDLLVSPAAEDYAVVTGNGAVGIRPGGWLRRLALAWTFQSLRLLSRTAVPSEAVIVWRRAVVRRLDHYAPFAKFETPYPVVDGTRLQWVAWGYVAAEAFPLAPPVRWRTRTVRYLRAGLIGVVDAATGATAVYLVRQPDPVSAAWARLAPDIVQPADRLPAVVLEHLRYPEELFAAQGTLFLGGTSEQARLQPPLVRSPREVGRPRSEALSRPAWVVGTLPGDSGLEVRLQAVLERGEPSSLAGLLDGSLEGTQSRLQVFRFAEPVRYPGPSLFAARITQDLEPGLGAAGPVLVHVFREGAVLMRAIYRIPPTDSATPRFYQMAATMGEGVGRGPDAASAVRAAAQEAGAAAAGAGDWAEARRWFRHLDAARRAGDWAAFGRAYERLRRALGIPPDTVR